MQKVFYKPETGYAVEDLETKITETILNLHLKMGNHGPSEAMFRMFELSFPHATPQEIEAFTKLQGAFRLIDELVRNNTEDFGELLREQSEYQENNEKRIL